LAANKPNRTEHKVKRKATLKLVTDVGTTPRTLPEELAPSGTALLQRILEEGIMLGDSGAVLARLPRHSRVHPDRYVDWFLPFARAMYNAAKPSGSLILNIKNRVANRGPLRGQRHPYVYQLVLALQHMGWRWIETYIWAKPNAVPGRFGPRTKDSFEYVYHFARTNKPYFELNALRTPYRADSAEIERRKRDANGRRNTQAGFGRDRTKTYLLGGADPGNVVSVPQTYNQHYGVEHTAAMPEGLAEFFIKAASPRNGVVLDPFAGSATTIVVAKRLGRRAGGIDLHEQFVNEGRRRIAQNIARDSQGVLFDAAAV
jgi:DNA modification methylase